MHSTRCAVLTRIILLSIVCAVCALDSNADVNKISGTNLIDDLLVANIDLTTHDDLHTEAQVALHAEPSETDSMAGQVAMKTAEVAAVKKAVAEAKAEAEAAKKAASDAKASGDTQAAEETTDLGVAEAEEPTLSTTCADTGSSNVDISDCTGWVQNHCGKSWADSACAKSCGVCKLCTLGDWGDWSECTSTCGGGARYRSRSPGDCGDDYAYTVSEQCNTDVCDPGPACSLSESSPLVITTDGQVVENISITTDGVEPAIFVYGASDVVLRNIKIIHTGHERVKGTKSVAGTNMFVDESGAGIYFQKSPNIVIENVHVSLVRPSPNPQATDGVCADEYCGPFPYELFYAYNIYGSDSDSPRVSNVYVTGGSTGFWCKNCPHGKVSHFKAENLHGPFPRGQCFQVVSSTGFTLEDFTCVQDNQIAFPEDDISVWDSPYSTVQRGLIQGGNAPNGVGVIFEMSQTYASDQSVPDKTCCGTEALTRCDTEGGLWFAGDYTSGQAGGAYSHQASNISIKQGVFYNMTRIESDDDYTNVGECVNIDMNDWATSAANRQEAWILKDFANEDFTLRVPFTPSFCFSTD